MASAALTGCQKLDDLDPIEQEQPALRRAPHFDPVADDDSTDEASNGRSGRLRPTDDPDNVNDDDDSEDSDEIQGVVKRN